MTIMPITAPTWSGMIPIKPATAQKKSEMFDFQVKFFHKVSVEKSVVIPDIFRSALRPGTRNSLLQFIALFRLKRGRGMNRRDTSCTVQVHFPSDGDVPSGTGQGGKTSIRLIHALTPMRKCSDS